MAGQKMDTLRKRFSTFFLPITQSKWASSRLVWLWSSSIGLLQKNSLYHAQPRKQLKFSGTTSCSARWGLVFLHFLCLLQLSYSQTTMFCLVEWEQMPLNTIVPSMTKCLYTNYYDVYVYMPLFNTQDSVLPNGQIPSVVNLTGEMRVELFIIF